MFSDHPGLREVVDGNFELVDKQSQLTVFDGRDVIPRMRRFHYQPSDAVQPGAKLLMNILRVKTVHAPKATLITSVQTLETCPRCGFATPGRQFRRCANCDMDFKKSVRELYEMSATPADREDWPNDPLPRTILDSPPIDYAPTKPPNADMETEQSRLPLIQAVGQGDLHWVREILLKTDTASDTRDCQNWTALQNACAIKTYSPESRNQEAIVRLLISQGADVNSVPGEISGRTALQAACGAGNEKIVDLLLEKGADVNEDGSRYDGQSSLLGAVRGGHVGIVKRLLDLGADTNQVGTERFGGTALSTAAELGHLKILDFLIENGANTQGSAGLIALNMAIEHNRLNIANRLLEKGLDVNSCDNGCAPLHSVRSIDMLNLLVTYGARYDVPGSEASEFNALQRAAQYESLNLVTELVRLGSDVHHPGPAEYGKSALQAAAARCRDDVEESVDILSFLIEEHGADVNEPRSGERGYTSLEAACQATAMQDENERSIDRVKFLVEKGAVITPFTLHVAAARNHTELLDYLLRNGTRIEDISSPAHVSSFEGYTDDYCKFRPTVIETARSNDHMASAEALETWSSSTQLEIHAGKGDLDREDSEREYPDMEDSH
ncbi:unnamed protein product [Alternaria alternata]